MSSGADQERGGQGLRTRLELGPLLRRFPSRFVFAGFVLVNGFVTIAVLAGLAMATRMPFVFPSLGPTAFLLFYTPLAPSASPRHSIIGHAIGIACGALALLVTGLWHAPAVTVTGVSLERVLAAALSLSLTGALMILARAGHPPAGATTLIVSLGIITRVWHLILIELAVGVLVLQAILINRLAGIPYPLWSTREQPPPGLPRPEDKAPESS